jgi:hypothetical protein
LFLEDRASFAPFGEHVFEGAAAAPFDLRCGPLVAAYPGEVAVEEVDRDADDVGDGVADAPRRGGRDRVGERGVVEPAGEIGETVAGLAVAGGVVRGHRTPQRSGAGCPIRV